MITPLVEAIGVSKQFTQSAGLFRRGTRAGVAAVEDCSLAIAEGATVGLVGSSGSGKSTLSRLLLGLLQPSAGEVRFDGNRVDGLSEPDLRPLRRRMQIVFQDPLLSLNRRRSAIDNVGRPLANFGASRKQARARAAELLDQVGIDPRHGGRFPTEFSGGQCQRIAIARALALNPDFIILDEPVSALDVSVQAQILNLLSDVQKQRRLTYLFVTHDLGLVQHFCDDVAVMHRGRLVDRAPAKEIGRSTHDFTKYLFDSAER